MDEIKQEFFTEQLAPDLWRFNEGMGKQPYVDAYLLIGKKRAAFIDALQNRQPVSLADQIRAITDLPVDVLITHGHPDHAGAEVLGLSRADGFTMYMSHADLPIAKSMFARADADSSEEQKAYAAVFTEETFRDVREGDRFDLGGTVLETYRVAGHTPGSMCFLDRQGRRCFTGDAFGVWLQLDHSLKMQTYHDEIVRFQKALRDIPETLFYSGHLAQANPINTAVHADNMRILCEKIMSGEYSGEAVKLPPEMANSHMAEVMRGAYNGVYKTAHMAYNHSKL